MGPYSINPPKLPIKKGTWKLAKKLSQGVSILDLQTCAVGWLMFGVGWLMFGVGWLMLAPAGARLEPWLLGTTKLRLRTDAIRGQLNG